MDKLSGFQMQMLQEQLISLSFTTIFILSLFTQSAGVDVKPQQENYVPDYTYYHNMSSIEAELSSIITGHANFMQLNNDYKSSGGRSQLVFRLTNFSSEIDAYVAGKVRVLLSFGEHAREFFPVESMLYFIQNVTAGASLSSINASEKKFSSWVLNNFDIIFIGMANPDGRDYIERTENYCWRGTRTGVDINRNFDWNFGGQGSSNNPTDGDFRGPHAFSGNSFHMFDLWFLKCYSCRYCFREQNS